MWRLQVEHTKILLKDTNYKQAYLNKKWYIVKKEYSMKKVIRCNVQATKMPK